ncbi:MAG TPA: valine--tRNA ligase [Aldersonia sp.]
MSTASDDTRTRGDALPKAWNPGEAEAPIYQRWLDGNYFYADVDSSKPPFCMVLPPPNVTGSLHMGHALEHVVMDAIARRRRMQGYNVLWLPGTDHAAIATEKIVETQLADAGIAKADIGRAAFLEKVWEWKERSGDTIGGQMRALGDCVDWSRDRFTMDDGLAVAVQTVFKRMYDDGLIYRAERLVNWSPELRTAISDIEVKHDEVEGELVSLRYGSLNDDEPHVVVATTRVETMLGDTAVAVHPDDARYRDLIGTTLYHPITGRQIPVLADEYVDPEFGSGALKITPAHDPNDFEMGLRHDLPMPNIMDEGGAIAGTGTEFDGMDRFEARVKVRERLAREGRVVAEKRPYLHSVGHSERSGEAIEPRLSLQWWVKVESLATAAGDAVRRGDTVVHPTSLEPRWFDWVDNMHDWCISRQLWWGHRIPIWYGPDGETVCLGPGETPPEGWVQDPDVLDTWFSSGLWPFATLGWPERTPDLATFYPNSVLVTGYDILFFWVARMMMFGLYVGDDETITGGGPGPLVPFRDLFLHGLIRDQYGKKMSKSRGNGIDPLDWVRLFGADALRFTLARGTQPGGDLSIGESHAAASRNFVTKLYNAVRFALLNGASAGRVPDRADLTDADRWILDRLAAVTAEVDAAFERYEFGRACEALYHFTWDEVCDWYLELAKIQIGTGPDTAVAASTRAVLGTVLDGLLRLLHPVIPFVTETLWQALTDGESVVIAVWPQPVETDTAETDTADAVAAQRITDLQRLVTEVRRFRSDQGLKDRQKVAARFVGLDDADLAGLAPAVAGLAQFTPPDDGFAASAAVEVRLTGGTVTVEIDTSGAVDLDAERRRLEKDLAAAEKELAGTAGKLSNDAFLAKAPAEVVDKIRTRQQLARDEVERLGARLATLGSR